MRKAKVDPCFTQYLDGLADGQPLPLVLTGHLVLEALLVELIQLDRSGNGCWRWNFPDKVNHCVKAGRITVAEASFYLRLNDIRNDLAHILGHRLSYDELFDFVRQMADAGFDFSDDTIHLDRRLSEEWYGFEGCLMEILNNLYVRLAEALKAGGGPDRL